MRRRQIFLMRHGEIDRAFHGCYVGRTDLYLTDYGESQARIWAHELSKVKLERIYCSDLKRSRETSRIIAGERGIPIEVSHELREIDLGEWDGRPFSEIKSEYSQEWKMRGMNLESFRPPGGESFGDLAVRVLPVFESIVRRTRNDTLIVGHAGVNRVILSHALGMPLSNILAICQDYGCMNVIEVGEGWFRVQALNAPPVRHPGAADAK